MSHESEEIVLCVDRESESTHSSPKQKWSKEGLESLLNTQISSLIESKKQCSYTLNEVEFTEAYDQRVSLSLQEGVRVHFPQGLPGVGAMGHVQIEPPQLCSFKLGEECKQFRLQGELSLEYMNDCPYVYPKSGPTPKTYVHKPAPIMDLEDKNPKDNSKDKDNSNSNSNSSAYKSIYTTCNNRSYTKPPESEGPSLSPPKCIPPKICGKNIRLNNPQKQEVLLNYLSGQISGRYKHLSGFCKETGLNPSTIRLWLSDVRLIQECPRLRGMLNVENHGGLTRGCVNKDAVEVVDGEEAQGEGEGGSVRVKRVKKWGGSGGGTNSGGSTHVNTGIKTQETDIFDFGYMLNQGVGGGNIQAMEPDVAQNIYTHNAQDVMHINIPDQGVLSALTIDRDELLQGPPQIEPAEELSF